jgi:hypothetical protein
MKILASLLLLLLPLAAAGCGCTAASCYGGVTFRVSAFDSSFRDALPVTVKVCQDARCGTFTVLEQGGEVACQGAALAECLLDAGDLVVLLSATTVDTSQGEDLGSTVATSVAVTDMAGAPLFTDSATVETTDVSPNGPICGPTCRSAAATFTPVSK